MALRIWRHHMRSETGPNMSSEDDKLILLIEAQEEG
jgi:hypothetical protein